MKIVLVIAALSIALPVSGVCAEESSSFESRAGHLKDLIQSPDEKARIGAARMLGEAGKKSRESRREYAGFLIEMLRNEENYAVEKAVSEALYAMGEEALDQVGSAYAGADDSLRKKLSDIFPGSEMRAEDLYEALPAKAVTGTLKKYFLWALASVDPFRFGEAHSGTLRRQGGNVVLISEGKSMKLIRPWGAGADVKRFGPYLGRLVTVYGAPNGGLIYTRIFSGGPASERKK